MIMKTERMITEKMIMRKMIIRTCFLFCYANMTPPLVPAVGSPWSLSSSHPSPIQSQCLRSISLDFQFSILLCNYDKSPIQSQCLRSISLDFQFSILLYSIEKFPFQIYKTCDISALSQVLIVVSHWFPIFYKPVWAALSEYPMGLHFLPIYFLQAKNSYNAKLLLIIIAVIIRIIFIVIRIILTTLAATASIQFTPLLCTLSSVPFKLCPWQISVRLGDFQRMEASFNINLNPMRCDTPNGVGRIKRRNCLIVCIR